MANLPESPIYEEGIYQLEITDPVLGGPDGISNLQAKQLANRTKWLKNQVDNLNTEVDNIFEELDSVNSNLENLPTLIQSTNLSRLQITDFSHTHNKSEITDFSHTHNKSEITDFSHTHNKSEITDFSHTHTASEITDIQNAINQGLGYNQTWVNVTSSRTNNVTYTNTTGKPIAVAVLGSSTRNCDYTRMEIIVQGIVVGYNSPYCYGSAFAIVPPGATYKIYLEYNILSANIFELR